VSLDRLLHGDLLGVTTSVKELRLVSVKGLRLVRSLVSLTSLLLALALLVIETTTIPLWSGKGKRSGGDPCQRGKGRGRGEEGRTRMDSSMYSFWGILTA
jgi:hypothetical protein